MNLLCRAGWGALVLAGALSGCAPFAPTPGIASHAALQEKKPVEHFRLEGRLSIRADPRQFSGTLQWLRESAEQERLVLTAPLGQGVAEIRRIPDGMELVQADGTIRQAESAEALLHDATGMRLPVEGLVYWLSALPQPDRTFTADLDDSGRLATLRQDGWKIDYGRYRELGGRWLPGRLFAERGEDLAFRLVVDQWEALP